ncbi:hypothetical protein GCM10022223_14480 [Kineosporia mesophila]|uniref:Uncharacterized protein n=1 Tax=Kineosporia mesophila TaxID=566012 RepID=A0ABP6Z808_9ACTN
MRLGSSGSGVHKLMTISGSARIPGARLVRDGVAMDGVRVHPEVPVTSAAGRAGDLCVVYTWYIRYRMYQVYTTRPWRSQHERRLRAGAPADRVRRDEPKGRERSLCAFRAP